MKMQLTKGPTITPAIFPVPDQFGQLAVIGFSGMSELDYVAAHLLCAFASRDLEVSDEALIDHSIMMAMRLLAKTNEINQRRNGPQQEEPEEKSSIITG